MKPIYAIAAALIALPLTQMIIQSRRRAKWRKMAKQTELLRR